MREELFRVVFTGALTGEFDQSKAIRQFATYPHKQQE